MKKSNRIDLSNYKRITNEEVIDATCKYLIVKRKNLKGIIDINSNKDLVDYNFSEYEFIEDDLFWCRNLIEHIKNLKNNRELTNNEIDIYKDCILVEFFGCKIYDYNLNNIFNIDRFSSTFGSDIYIIEDKNGNVLFKKSRNRISIIDANRFLIYQGKNVSVIDIKKNVLCEVKQEKVSIDYDTGLLFRYLTNSTSYIGFINNNNEIINLEFDDYEIVDQDTIIINVGGLYTVIDSNGNFKINDSYEHLTYDKINHLFIFKKINKYGLLDSNFKLILDSIYDDIVIIGDRVYKVYDDSNSFKLVNNEKKVIYEFDKSNNLEFKNKDNLITIDNEKAMSLIDINGNTVIPFINQKIILMGDNKILIDNCIIDLNAEYLDLRVIYELELDCCGSIINKAFETDSLREKFISEVNAINIRYESEIKRVISSREYDDTWCKKKIING